jgi:hypothetical protein
VEESRHKEKGGFEAGVDSVWGAFGEGDERGVEKDAEAVVEDGWMEMCGGILVGGLRYLIVWDPRWWWTRWRLSLEYRNRFCVDRFLAHCDLIVEGSTVQ